MFERSDRAFANLEAIFRAVQIEGDHRYLVCICAPHGDRRSIGYGTRKNKAAIIVGMLTEQIDPTRRISDKVRRAAISCAVPPRSPCRSKPDYLSCSKTLCWLLAQSLRRLFWRKVALGIGQHFISDHELSDTG